MTDPTTHTGWALIFGSVFILCAYGLVRLTCSAWSEHQAQRAELTMQEAAAAPFVAPFAHTLDAFDRDYQQHVADALALTERVSVSKPLAPVIPMQRGGSRG